MVLLVFLIDTSASMNQRTCLGTSYLDLAKGAVESFLKIRARETNASRGDRYMLVTYAEPTKSVKAGWRENLQVFLKELKNLQGCKLSNVACALKETFDLLNMHRLQSGIDNYGMGRNPYYLEPALVLLLTDGCSSMDINGIISEISLATHNLLPGGELTKELYRWDQRLFAVNLKVPGFASAVTDRLSVVQPDDFPLSNLCELTGGKLYCAGSHKNLMQSLESIAQKIMIPGVIINFEKQGADPEDLQKEGRPITPKIENETLSPIPHDVNHALPPHVHRVMSHENQPSMMNGFISNSVNGILDPSIDKMPNGFAMEPPKLAVGAPHGGRGLLPSPILPPGIPPLMAPQLQLRGLLHPPSIPGSIPLLPFPPHINNRLILPVKNVPPILHPQPQPPQINGKIEPMGSKICDIKSEGQNTSSPVITGNPVRGDEQATNDPTRNVMSPNGPTTNSVAWQNQRRMIFVRTNVKGSVGHWPIPEGFWPTSSTTRMPPRDCHPIVKYQCQPSEAMIIDNMPFDKYELEPSPLTQFILERKQPNVAWQTFISGSSSTSDLGYPFGYLKAATNLLCVNLFVMPYNYPTLMPLLDELFKIHKCKPSLKWRQSFDEYLQTMPSYYSNPLRNALRRMGAPNNLLPDHFDGSSSYSVISYLKKVKHQAKIEAERLASLHSQQLPPEVSNVAIPSAPQLVDGKNRDFKELLFQKTSTSINKELYDKIKKANEKSETKPSEHFANRYLPFPVEKFQVASFKNPFDTSRERLLQQIGRMRVNFFHLTTQRSKIHDEDSSHRMSIAQMGNYQEHLNNYKPLREVDPSQVRVHTFGNPFKLKQDQIIAIDEADVNENIPLNQNSRKRANDNSAFINQKNKRKRSEKPPPSRRPVGPPNTPPPKTEHMIRPPIEPIKQVLQDFKKTNGNNEVNGLNIDIAVKKEDILSTDKKHTSVNKQLRKLQEMRRTKKNEKLTDSVKQDDKQEDLTETFDQDSPILSILRTSLEEQSDKEDFNDELLNINKNSTTDQNVITRSSSNSSSSTRSTVVLTPAIRFDELSPVEIRKATLELQTRNVVKLRMLLWKGLREKKGFAWVSGHLKQMVVTNEAKYLFITKMIEEANRFQLEKLTMKLRSLLVSLRRSATES